MVEICIRLSLIFSFLSIGCGPSQKNKVSPPETTNAQPTDGDSYNPRQTIYDLSNPSEIYILDSELKEISGLAYDKKKDVFLTINDEQGHLFTLNGKFDIVADERFAKKGDYESLAIIDNHVIIGKSTGTIYFYNSVSKKTKSYNTKLSGRNDVEGLCFDPLSNSLLLACKGLPLKAGGGRKNSKSIYSFDLENRVLKTDPYFSISDDELKTYVTTFFEKESKAKLKKLVNRVQTFAPSGIAIHQDSGDYYLVSGKGSLLVIVDKRKHLQEVIFLDSKSNPQPEGITFDSANNLYISTEGQGFSGKVFKYNYNG